MAVSDNPFYHVFLSHSHQDAGIVGDIAGKLENLYGLRVWLDVWELVPGRPFIQGMEKGLAQAKSCAVCLGRGTPQGWFQQEIGRAENRQAREPEFGVIPVLLPDADESSVGDFLGLNTWVDLRGGVGDEDAVYKLVCGIEGKAPGRGRSQSSDTAGPSAAQAQAGVAVSQGSEPRPAQSAAAATQRASLCPLDKYEFSDAQVLDVVEDLRRTHMAKQQEFLEPEELFPLLDLLFNRKTFRYESLRKCPERRWGDRLQSAYQTITVVKAYMRNVQVKAPAKYPVYQELVGALETYAMRMGAHLFQPPVDFDLVKNDIGKSSFLALLPPLKRFGDGVYPDIPNADNNPVETERRHAVRLMNQLMKDLTPAL